MVLDVMVLNDIIEQAAASGDAEHGGIFSNIFHLIVTHTFTCWIFNLT